MLSKTAAIAMLWWYFVPLVSHCLVQLTAITVYCSYTYIGRLQETIMRTTYGSAWFQLNKNLLHLLSVCYLICICVDRPLYNIVCNAMWFLVIILTYTQNHSFCQGNIFSFITTYILYYYTTCGIILAAVGFTY